MARPRTRTLTLIAGDQGRDLPLRHRWTAPHAPPGGVLANSSVPDRKGQRRRL